MARNKDCARALLSAGIEEEVDGLDCSERFSILDCPLSLAFRSKLQACKDEDRIVNERHVKYVRGSETWVRLPSLWFNAWGFISILDHPPAPAFSFIFFATLAAFVSSAVYQMML